VGGVCGDGLVDAGEDCDGANLAGEDCLTAGAGDSGTLACAADCTFDTAACTVTPGNGIRFPGAEQCDDGNATAGDGCDAAGLLEDTTTVTVNANSAALNNQTAAAATKSVFLAAQDAFDLDDDGAADASFIMVVSTDDVDVCDTVLNNGGFNGFLNALFGGVLEGTYVLTMLQTPAGTPLAAGTFTGVGFTGLDLLTAGTEAATIVDSGFLIADGTGALSDTTFGSNGTGTMDITSFVFDGATGAGNLSLTTTGIDQNVQFIPAQTNIVELIAVDVTGAVFCTLDF
jgi:cysteine-rich repeat protein